MREPSRDAFAPALRRVPAFHRVPKEGGARLPPGLFLPRCRPLKCLIHTHTLTPQSSHSHTHSHNDPDTPQHRHACELALRSGPCIYTSIDLTHAHKHGHTFSTPTQIHIHTGEPNPFPSEKGKTKSDFSFPSLWKNWQRLERKTLAEEGARRGGQEEEIRNGGRAAREE